MAELSRLHYKQISDNPINWTDFFRELRNPLPDWREESVLPGEETNLSGIAYRIYGAPILAYVVREALGLDDTMQRVDAGTVFHVPKPAYLRERILYHKAKAEKLDG
ncbi:MAG: hypothetical protein GY866_36475 [Proteobacteria bacterium]|nr:hypothetical protein [Pseudomonadota bacterium]